MQKIFMCLLEELAKHGNVIETNLYRTGDFASITIKTDEIVNQGKIYRVSIAEEVELNGNG